MKALLIYSGGLDSTVMLYEYRQEIKLCVNFDYGSKHNGREYYYAKKNCKELDIPIIQISLDFINNYFKSALLKKGGDIPDGHYEDDSMKKTVVPFRNGVMLSVAAGLAESKGLSHVMIANHFGDHAIYPDCRQAFISYMHQSIMAGTYKHIELLAPYSHLNKSQVVVRGRVLCVGFKDTWSCYKGGRIHCGTCGTCIERKEALQSSDPTKYMT